MPMDIKSYRIIETVQESKRFLIYQAKAEQQPGKVVIKTQDPASLHDAALKESLVKEAQAAIKLKHPSIRRGLSSFEDASQAYLVAEYAEGISLARYLLNYPQGISFELALLWAKNIADALAYAQHKGIMHLNLNPYNIIIDPANELQIIGFGKDRKAWKHSEGNYKFHFPVLYIPPEEFKGSLIHPNSDIYSWAVIVYQMLTGSIAWRIDSFMSPEEQKEQCLTRAVQQVDANKLPSWLYSIILDCLKLDPAERIKNPAILAQALKLEGDYVDYEVLEELAAKAEWLQDLQAGEPAELPAEELEALVLDKPETPEAATVELSEPELNELCLGIDAEEPQLSEPHIEVDSSTMTDTAELIFEDENPLERLQQSLDTQATDHEIPAIQPQAPVEVEATAELSPLQEPSLAKEPEAKPSPAKEPEAKPSPAKSARVDSAPSKTQSLPPKADTTKIYYAPQPRQADLSGIEKYFRILMWVSLVIVVFLVGRYFISRPQTGFEFAKAEVEELPEPSEGSLLKDNMPIDMILVPADSLVMGSISPEADDDEFPLLNIGLRSFMISVSEVTQEQWMMVYVQNPSQFKGDNLPVENVSFYEVIDFCNAKSLKDGLTPAYDIYGSEIVCDFEADGYRLPTEAEWEMAAKAGKGSTYTLFSGSAVAEDVAWFNVNSGARTRNVKSRQSNALGLCDLSGNVYEWVWNWYAPYTYRVSNLNTGPSSGTDKVIRGGSWYHDKDKLRVSNREYQKPFAKNAYTGFRMVRSH